jgi:hypothetical protein
MQALEQLERARRVAGLEGVAQQVERLSEPLPEQRRDVVDA